MTDYISRDAARKELIDWCVITGYGGLTKSDVDRALDNVPAADVVGVVRCRECKHRDPEDKKCDCGSLSRAGCIFPVEDAYFCAYGERPNCGAKMDGGAGNG